MRYGSVCSGIEAASVAWEPLGFAPAWFAEIAKFPSKLLATRYPKVPNHGSLVGLADRLTGSDRDIDLLVGGTPCQSYSVAGKREGRADPRGNLTWNFARLAEALRPRWVLWENVPGVLSSERGAAFGSLVGDLAQLGYGLAWRVLDAQFFGVAQRRERVFLVGHLGAAAAAGAVLFEPEGVRRNPPPRRATGEEIAGTLGGGTSGGFGGDLDRHGAFIPEVAATLKAATLRSNAGDTFIPEIARCLTASSTRLDAETETFVTASFDETQVTSPGNRSSCDPSTAALTKTGRPPSIAFHLTQDPIHSEEVTPCISSTSTGAGVCVTGNVTHALRSVGADASEDGTGRGTPITVALRGREGGATAELGGVQANALRAANGGGSAAYVLTNAVRRLTPRECERLQAFPDDYTDLGKDGPRYAALGNSMCVNVMRWIGERIALVDSLLTEAA